MTENFKILAQYIKDMSSETPDVQTYLFAKDNIFKYSLDIDISSKALKSAFAFRHKKLSFRISDCSNMHCSKRHFKLFSNWSFVA